VALRVAGLLVDEGDGLAVAFMNRPRPLEDGGDAQPAQVGRAVLAAIDLDARHRVAMALVRQCVELAVAAVLAGAVDEFAAFDFPRRHEWPPQERLRAPL